MESQEWRPFDLAAFAILCWGLVKIFTGPVAPRSPIVCADGRPRTGSGGCWARWTSSAADWPK